MNEFDLFGFQVEIDEVATKEWYDKAEEWGCECGDCRHFVALAKKRELPQAVIEVLQTFGIVPEKATYVCEIVTEEHKILYQFSYRLAGNILKEREEATKDFGWARHIAAMNHILMVHRDFLHRILIWSFGFDCQNHTSIVI